MSSLLTLLSVACAAPAPADLLAEFRDPPREFALMPFWFWNDALDADQIRAQIADFDAHGVFGFVIHPRLGLPRDTGWRSPKLYDAMQVAIEEAERRHMTVILYDEGMYPSGSSCGQVVARNPEFAARGLARVDLAAGAEPQLAPGCRLVARVGDVAIIEQPSGGTIRGLHWTNEGQKGEREDAPPAADLLNPAAVDCFVELVYQGFYDRFRPWFGRTIVGIFTDEPSIMGRGPKRGLVPGSAAVTARISEILGEDIRPRLPELWSADRDVPFKEAYHRALGQVFEETYYRRLSDWCQQHGVWLMGHPESSEDSGPLRYFQVPGQDLVWRYVVPGPTALEGGHSTMAKVAASAMVHLGRRRNSNELYGAYGHELTEDELVWLANWCLVRGQSWLFPHAFYYSVRGPRRDERPPDVGPHAAWWDHYRPYADACRRLCWVNTDSQPVCDIAILATAHHAPDKPARPLYEQQRDFHYLEARHLWQDATLEADGLHLAGQLYRAVIWDGTPLGPEADAPLQALRAAGRLVEPGDMAALDRLAPRGLTLDPPCPSVRLRQVTKGGRRFVMLFGEGETGAVAFRLQGLAGPVESWDPRTGEVAAVDLGQPVKLARHELRLLVR
ncbi:MAG: hypothetical protein HZB16_24740 [Armatimonadetes bacterium]|nr:hypothetical protein [Armatimonadota bacterium]